MSVRLSGQCVTQFEQATWVYICILCWRVQQVASRLLKAWKAVPGATYNSALFSSVSTLHVLLVSCVVGVRSGEYRVLALFFYSSSVCVRASKTRRLLCLYLLVFVCPFVSMRTELLIVFTRYLNFLDKISISYSNATNHALPLWGNFLKQMFVTTDPPQHFSAHGHSWRTERHFPENKQCYQGKEWKEIGKSIFFLQTLFAIVTGESMQERTINRMLCGIHTVKHGSVPF